VYLAKEDGELIMAILSGWSLDSFYGVDHTYVTSSDGHIWNCWGRNTGGQVICSGEAESSHAECLAQRKSHAGLLYGLTGVCHQTANRILFPANCIVSGATNYWLTVFFYGTYGLSVVKFQSMIKKCLGVEDLVMPRLEFNSQLTGEAAYLQRISQLYAHALTRQKQTGISKERMVLSLLQNELKLATAYRLGSEVDTKITNTLLQYQKELLKEKNYYDRALMAKRLAPARFAEKINEIATAAFKDISKSLGESRYQEMFGIIPEAQLIYPAIMHEFYRGKN